MNDGRESSDGRAEQYLPFVRKIATRIARRLPRSVEVEELVGAGTVGLMEALDRYDPAGGRSFETYAEFRVKGAIYDELRRNDPVNRAARSAQNRMESQAAQLTGQLGRPPEAEEMAKALQTSVSNVVGDLGRMEALKVVSLDADRLDLDDHEPSAEDQLHRQQAVGLMREALGRLNERQQMILNLYYVEELSLQQIGEVIGVTESRVSQILSQLRGQLRAQLVQVGV
ncbi:MAG: FliA/WhiG family RNA polymerase sigma factor [Deltaproteobacteria bacterium]|nr:FliA/WhiG family RNA polymerase sigma factor [Deltaproteobacteria bacterium]